MSWRLRRHLPSVLLGLGVWTLGAAAVAPVCLSAATPMARPGSDRQAGQESGQAVRISAQVDKTQVDLGARLTLTITLEGDLTKAELSPVEFPKAFQVIAQSRASNIELGMGNLKRSVSLMYILLAHTAGTFQLGPFQITYGGKPVLTDPIEIVVNTSRVPPPGLQEHRRYTL